MNGDSLVGVLEDPSFLGAIEKSLPRCDVTLGTIYDWVATLDLLWSLKTGLSVS